MSIPYNGVKLFNLSDFEIHDLPIDNDKIITRSPHVCVLLNTDENININIIDEIFMRFTNGNGNLIQRFKRLCYNSLVKLETNVVFIETHGTRTYSFGSLFSYISYKLEITDAENGFCYADKSDYKKMMENKRCCMYIGTIQ